MKQKVIRVMIPPVLVVIMMFILAACGGFGGWFRQNDNAANALKDSEIADDTQADDGGNGDEPPADPLSLSVSFAEDSWEIIGAVSASGSAQDYYAVGDEKDIVIGEKTYTVQILGFDHDDLSDSSGRAGITVGMQSVLIQHYNYNETDTNEGSWAASDMRNTHLPAIFNTLAADLQSAVKTVDKKTAIGGGSTELITTADKLFLLAARELSPLSSSGNTGEGESYEFYVIGGNSSRIKKRSGLNILWFLRSPMVTNHCLYGVNGSGGIGNNYNANQTNVYTSFGFCV